MLESKVLFICEKKYICHIQVIFDKNMTQIFDPPKSSKYLENEIDIYYAKH